jgi:hypothetical protein
MYRGSSPYYKVMIYSGKTFQVCHADAPIGDDLQDIGQYGTADECWEFVEAYEGKEGYIFRMPIGG